MKSKSLIVLSVLIASIAITLKNMEILRDVNESGIVLKELDMQAGAASEDVWHYTNAEPYTVYCDDGFTSYTACESSLNAGSCDAGDETDCPGYDGPCSSSPNKEHVWFYINKKPVYCIYCKADYSD